MATQPNNPVEAVNFIDELKWRGLFHQCTNEAELREHLSDPVHHPRKAYAGFDPTADSLTIGNMIPMMLLLHFQRAGHVPVVVMGGGTGLIGDPSGKSAERQLMTDDRVRDNVDAQRPIFERLWRNAGLGKARPPVIVNNLDWLGQLSYIKVLRDVGKHFSVNMMIQKDSVRERLSARDQGISYTEFSYMILQSYDYLHLWQHQHVTVQMGGSDQWGNIVGGCDLIRRHAAESPPPPESILSHQVLPGLLAPGTPMLRDIESESSEAFGLTAPLVTKADGGKFGKTESGAVWMTADKTSPYAMYQFWLNVADDDVIRFLKLFTLLSRADVESLEVVHQQDPGKREAHRTLAREATALIHGEAERDQAEAAARALFSGDIAGLSLATLNEALAAAPSSVHSPSQLQDEGVSLLDLLPLTSLAKSKSEAKQSLTEGSISINGAKAALETRLTPANLLHGSIIAIRRGKKNWHVTRWD